MSDMEKVDFFYILAGSLGTLVCVGVMALVNRLTERPRDVEVTAPPPTRPRESSTQFVARMIAEQEAKNPADWWKRGESPAEWNRDSGGDDNGYF